MYICSFVYRETMERELETQNFPWRWGQGSGGRGMGERLGIPFYTFFLNHENIALIPKIIFKLQSRREDQL